MITYDWYKLFSLPEFLATGLVSRTLTVFLEDRGAKEILITKGNTIGVTYEGVFLPVGFAGRNPFERDSLAVFEDFEQNIWLGIEAPE
jgi:hypothetical protein